MGNDGAALLMILGHALQKPWVPWIDQVRRAKRDQTERNEPLKA
jgi:hypothetical protein